MGEIDYQAVYRQVYLSDGQKSKIWKGVKERAGKPSAERKARFSMRWAVCVCAVLAASGITVFAVNSSYAERIAKAMGYFTGKGEEAAQNQTDLYTEYGSVMEQSGTSAAGEVRIEAALYDRGYLCIPFTLYPDTEWTPGSDISSEPMFQEMAGKVIGSVLYYSDKGEELEGIWRYTQIDPVVQEDGSLTGSVVVGNTDEEGFAQGGTIRLIRQEYTRFSDSFGRVLADGEDAAGLKTFEVLINGDTVTYVEPVEGEEALAEFQLEHARVPEMEISTAGVSLPYGIRTDKMIISPLALYLYGTADDMHPAAKITYNIWVVLKDGSVAEWAGNGFTMLDREDQEDHEYGFRFSIAFADVMDLEDIAGVRITDRGEEICFIPVE